MSGYSFGIIVGMRSARQAEEELVLVLDLIQNRRKISCQTECDVLSLYGCGMIAMREKITVGMKTARHKFLQRTFRSECQV